MYWPGCQDGGLRQKEYQSWVADPALFQVIPHYYRNAGFDETIVNLGITMCPVGRRERSVSPPATHGFLPHEVGDVPVLSLKVWCVQGLPFRLSVLTHGHYLCRNPLSLFHTILSAPVFNPGNEVTSFTNFACPITSPTCTGELGVPDTTGNSGIMAFCDPFLLTRGVPEELSILGSITPKLEWKVGYLCQTLLLSGPQTILGQNIAE